jgi:hypothetical protein
VCGSAEEEVAKYSNELMVFGGGINFTGGTADEIRAELRGKDLACFCRLAQPVHADVLLELANETER